MNAQLVSGKLWVGVLFIVAGVIIFLDQLHLISFWQLFSTWWPLLLLGIGLTKLIARSGSPAVAILLLALGAILQLQRLRLLRHRPSCRSFFRSRLSSVVPPFFCRRQSRPQRFQQTGSITLLCWAAQPTAFLRAIFKAEV
jgi:hypothetical protein